jgi:hypothetical protein
MWPQRGAGPAGAYVYRWHVIDECIGIYWLVRHHWWKYTYLRWPYIPQGFHRSTDEIILNLSVSLIKASVLTDEYLLVSYSAMYTTSCRLTQTHTCPTQFGSQYDHTSAGFIPNNLPQNSVSSSHTHRSVASSLALASRASFGLWQSQTKWPPSPQLK